MTTLFVASTGGHLNELVTLAPRLVPRDDDILWVTHDTLQSRSLLGDSQTVFVPDLGSRDLPGTAAMALRAWRILHEYRPERVLSTGSSIAVAFLSTARTLGMACHYIESGTRVTGPSVTGRILQHIPGVHCYTQHAQWASGRWSCAGSILDGFEQEAVNAAPRLDRVVVTLGSWRQPFRRLIEHLIPLLPIGAEVLWQTGHTDVSGLVDRPTPWLSAAELHVAIRKADLVVTHAGMGAVLDALDAGRCPVVVPRVQEHGEQIDDHQVELAAELGRRGLAVVSEPGALTTAALLDAASRRITRSSDARPFLLAPP
jgi:UDP-N-acetylglucosamine--N-acetylmuramyl-(pentapeptide) pyrophosphoryl-undecaprenol N-acetylglucosamine transferase